MSVKNLIGLAGAFAVLTVFANARPELVGVMVSQGITHVAVRLDEGGSALWVKIGDSVGEYRAMAYDPVRDSLLLKQGDTETELTLKVAAVQPAPTLALLTAVVWFVWSHWKGRLKTEQNT